MTTLPKTAMVPPSTSDKFPNGDEMFGPVVDVLVGRGDAAQSFKVHKGVLCFYSAYFKGALEGKFREAGEGAVKLPTEKPNVFKTFTIWLYSRRLANPIGEDDYKQFTIPQLCEVWVFADAHQVPLLQNETLNLLHKKICREWTVNVFYIEFLYKHTTSTSGLRKFYMEAVVKNGSAATHLTPDKHYAWPKEALLDAMQWVWKHDKTNISRAQFEKWDLCQYHVHEEGVKCKKEEAAKK